MDIKQIQDLIRFVSKSGVNEVEIEQKDFKITIRTNQQPIIAQHALTAPAVPQPTPLPQPQAVPASAPAINSPTAAAAEDTSKFVTIKSPMIGTFYRSASPDKPMFVNVGDEIKAGQTLCIIEAMKLFNEIESEVAGKVVKILVDNSSPVEYDQPLFLIDPA
ncbi:MAG: acetyl-CoA carboxylase biotin carboxyl carrier protein [Mucilaginibacter polytrichastri]|nr:acetyl-CoA carboxylase biotin carboxyl carrier protein [Mucilaginibacter polytrichastri]